jgi:TPR repeat protein
LGDRWSARTIQGWIAEKKDLVEADRIYKSCIQAMIEDAEAQDPIALDWLAWGYCEGHGVEKDILKGMRLFEESANLGLAWAMLWLGIRNCEGTNGALPNKELGIRWLKAACERGIPDAAEALEKYKA